MTLRLRHGFLFCIFGAAVVSACSIKLDETADGENPSAECLELFETCVELAGTSQGCEELYAHCEGSAGGTEGVEPPDGCAQGYIDCLAQGGDASSCEPLLDACSPGTGDTGGCDPMEPGCAGESGIGPIDTGECPAGDESCNGTNDPMECEARHEQCQQTSSPDGVTDPSFCDAILGACLEGNCESAVEICLDNLQDAVTCAELTGCETDLPPHTDCEQLLAECESMGVPPSECVNVYPDYAECNTGTYQCDWYFGECEGQFSAQFCNEGGQACEAGWLPEVFECAFFFPDACDLAGLEQTACGNAEVSCNNGFLDVGNCAPTPLAEDPYQWLADLAECNNWNEPN